MTTTQHTSNVLVHLNIYVYTKTEKKEKHMKCSLMEPCTERNVHLSKKYQIKNKIN